MSAHQSLKYGGYKPGFIWYLPILVIAISLPFLLDHLELVQIFQQQAQTLSVPLPASGKQFNTLPPGSTLPTGTPGQTNLKYTLFLHGTGKGGDNVNPTSIGNLNPLRPVRLVNITLSNANNIQLPVKQSVLTYDPILGGFKGTADLGSTFVTGPYIVRVKVTSFLIRQFTGIQMITKGQTTELSTISLVAGDINNDNSISILDYNILLDCFADLGAPRNCDINKKEMSDLNFDGNVNQFDYNLFLRELSVQAGQ